MIWNRVAPCSRIHGFVIMADPLQYKNRSLGKRLTESLLLTASLRWKAKFSQERNSTYARDLLIRGLRAEIAYQWLLTERLGCSIALVVNTIPSKPLRQYLRQHFALQRFAPSRSKVSWLTVLQWRCWSNQAWITWGFILDWYGVCPLIAWASILVSENWDHCQGLNSFVRKL